MILFSVHIQLKSWCGPLQSVMFKQATSCFGRIKAFWQLTFASRSTPPLKTEMWPIGRSDFHCNSTEIINFITTGTLNHRMSCLFSHVSSMALWMSAARSTILVHSDHGEMNCHENGYGHLWAPPQGSCLRYRHASIVLVTLTMYFHLAPSRSKDISSSNILLYDDKHFALHRRC